MSKEFGRTDEIVYGYVACLHEVGCTVAKCHPLIVLVVGNDLLKLIQTQQPTPLSRGRLLDRSNVTTRLARYASTQSSFASM